MIIVCPNTLKLNWRNELAKWLVRPMTVAVQYSNQPYAGDGADVLIINYDIVNKFKRQLDATAWDLRVLDEGHYCKSPKAARTKATRSIPARFKLELTGTPILNRPIEMFPALNDLDQKSWPSWYKYAVRYCDGKRSKWGFECDGATHLDELQERLRSSIMVRRLKSEVLTELPAKRRQVVEFQANGANGLVAEEQAAWDARSGSLDALRARVELAKASEDQSAYAEAVDALREGQGAAFADMARIRAELGKAKIPYAVEFVRDAIENHKVIVFCHHHEVVNGLLAEFPQAAVVSGETPADLRQGQVERFQTDPACNVFIGTTAAAEGLTLTEAKQVIFVEGQWVPGKLAQMEDRAHRIGQRDSVLISYLVFEGSLDVTMAKTCVAKMEIADKALDREHDPVAYPEPPVFAPSSRSKSEPATAGSRRDRILKLAETVTDEEAAAVHSGLRSLAALDPDRAGLLNDVGFSAVDGMIGHELANAGSLSRRQAALGMILCNKYRRQLGAGPWERVAAKKDL